VAVLFGAMVLTAAGGQSLPPVAVGTPEETRFSGGPLDGLSIGDVVTPNGHHFRGLVASKANASPIRAEDSDAVEAFVKFHAAGPASELGRYLAANANFTECHRQATSCDINETKTLTFGEPVVANTPYLMSDGSVRVEWLYGSALYYISTIELDNGKIVSVSTSPAWMPLGFSAIVQDKLNG
jgi:hypothetical protein